MLPIAKPLRESDGFTIRKDVDEKAVRDEPGYYQFTYSQPYEVNRNRRPFSRVEVQHLLVASGLLVFVSLSLVITFFPLYIPPGLTIADFFVLTAILFISFLPHELMHKAVAQKYGLFAEFRIIPSYAMLTLLTAILPLFRMFAPGAVMIAGEARPEAIGKTAAAGPAYNIVIGGTMLGLGFLFPDFAFYLFLGAYLSGWLALFNLFPVPPLDGEKVLHWSRSAFLTLFAGAILLFGYAVFMYLTYFT